MLASLLGHVISLLGLLLSVLISTIAWILTPIPLLVITTCVASVYLWYTRDYGFWRKQGVRGPTATFPYGISGYGPPLFTLTVDMDTALYYEHGGKKYCGYLEYSRPALFVGDPDLIRTIAIKDFDSFSNLRKIEASSTFREMLSSLGGEKWKHTRSVMSPTFSTSKLRGMHDITLANADHLAKYVLDEMTKKNEVEIRDASNRFTMDNIASCAFGVDTNSFKDPNTKFIKMADKFFRPSTIENIMLAVMLLLPTSLGKYAPDPFTESSNFFNSVTEKTIAERQRSGIARRDFLQLLIDSKDKDGNPALSRNSIVQQCVLFFIVGLDTTATLLMFTSFALARHPDVQQRLHEEIDEVLSKHVGDITYEAIMEMPYLDRVIFETLRLYPPATQMEREVTKDYILPGTSITLPVGTLVQVPVYMIHHDPEYYPDPETFDPDRFLPEKKDTRHPCTFIPFGTGPRNCIAMRFALFEAKVALVAMLKKMTLEPSDKTPPMPCPLDKSLVLPSPEGGKMYVRAIPRSAE